MRTFSIRSIFSLLLQCLLLLPGLLHATAWVSRHGMTGAQYQTEFNKWTGDGLRLRCVSGYTVGGTTYYAAIWDDTYSPGWGAGHGMTAAQVATANSNNATAGYEPSFINMYEAGGAIYYAVIWQASGLDTVTRTSRTWAQFQSDLTQQAAANYDLASYSACSVSGTDYYSGIWRERRGIITVQQATSLRLDGPSWQADFNLRTSQGYRLIMVCGYQVGGEDRYSALWRKPFGEGWWSYNGLSAANYQTETHNAAYQGCRTEFVSVFPSGGQARFNAVWTGNGGLPFECLGIINDGIAQYMQTNNTAGVSLAIMRDGRLVYAKGFGYADQESGDWAGPQHRFRIASISKPITAAAILKLTEQSGTFSVGDKVFGTGAVFGTQYGDGTYSTREKAITVRHLLTHTTGWTSDGPMWDNAYGADHEAIMDWTLDSNEPSFPPGNNYQYMNLDYHALGRIIEKYSGQTYEAYCKSAILTPAGATGMEIGNQTKAGRKPGEVVYYTPDGGDAYVDIDPHRMDANGGWISTAIDLLLFLRRVDNVDLPPDLLNATSATDMRMAGPAPNSGNYGDGWFWDGGSSWEGHNGCMSGTSSFLIHQANGTSYAVLANKRTGCSWELKAAVDAIIAQLDAKNIWPSYNLFPPNAGYSSWLANQFPNVTATDVGLIAWTGLGSDPDGDGVPNGIEAYFGTNPRVPGPPPLLSCRVEGRVSEAVWNWTRTRLNYGVSASPFYSTDLKTWANGGLEVNDLGGPLLIQTLEARMPRGSANKMFLHLQASEQ